MADPTTGIQTTVLTLTPPAPFDFARTAYSHGWVVLIPNRWDAEAQVLQRTERLRTGRVVHLKVSGEGSVAAPQIAIVVQHTGNLSPQEQADITASVGHMFRIDEDLSEFYALCRSKGGPWAGATQGLGRLLRSPSLFEDIVKTLCTTNIQWGGTKRIVEGLVATLGAPFPENAAFRAFPTPEAIAEAPPETFRETIHMGYRGAYIHTLAQQVAAGKLDLEEFQDPHLPTAALKQQLLGIKGVGPYAAATLLMLLGRYDELAVDTVFRDFVRKKYFNGDPPSEIEAQAIYEDWGKWKYLAYWFDLWTGLEEAL